MTFFEMFDAAKAGFAKADASNLNDHMAVQIEVTEEGAGIFYVEAANGVLNVQPYDYRDNTASVTLPNSTLFALLRRETTLPEAVAAGTASVDGCMESAAKLFATVPAPKKAAAPVEKVVKEEVKTAAAEATIKEEVKAAPTETAIKEEVKAAPAKEPVKETATAAKTTATTAKTVASTTTKTQPKRNCGRKKTK